MPVVLENLVEMVAQMRHIIAHQKLESEVLAIRRVPDILKGLGVNAANQARKLGVVVLPKPDDFQPGTFLIALHSNPAIAIVSRQIDAGRQLQTNKTLMIVGGGIYKVAEDLFSGPFARRPRRGCRGVFDLTQPVAGSNSRK